MYATEAADQILCSILYGIPNVYAEMKTYAKIMKIIAEPINGWEAQDKLFQCQIRCKADGRIIPEN